MSQKQPTYPVAVNAGVSLEEVHAAVAAAAATQEEVSHYLGLALAAECRFNALGPLYQQLRNEVGPALDEQFAQIRRDLLRAFDEEWHWSQSLTPAQSWMEYVDLCSTLIETNLNYLRADARLLSLAGGEKKKLRRLIRIVITQLVTFLEATRLPGCGPLEATSTSANAPT